MSEELIRCARYKKCSIDCGFKIGVKFEHLLNTLADVPHSDTVQAMNNHPDMLKQHIADSGWYIRCHSLIYPDDDHRSNINGRLFFNDARFPSRDY